MGANKHHSNRKGKQDLFNNGTKPSEKKDKADIVIKDGDQSDATKKKKLKSTWSNLVKYGRELWPYVWPSGDLYLQAIVVLAIVIILATRLVNVLVPVFYKKIVNSLTPDVQQPMSRNSLLDENDTLASTEYGFHQESDITPSTVTSLMNGYYVPTSSTGNTNGIEFRWDYILAFIALKSLHGGSGYLNCLRSFLWIKVAQNTKKKITLKLFKHLHHLSVRWHVTRKTGEVVRVMDRGTQSITLILNQVLFNIVPVIADIIIAIVFFVTVFNIWIGLIVFSTMTGYLLVTIIGSELRTKYRRLMNDTDNQRNAASVDSILNFETVKYYSAEDWEVKRYEENVDKYIDAEWTVNATANLLNALQKTMMMLGLLGGSMLCAWYTYSGTLTVGDYVLFATYVEQLYGPLNMFGAYYRVLQQAFVDMEHMFEMIEEEPDVQDTPEARQLCVDKGEITFDNVGFEYIAGKPIIQGISFTVPPGKTYALVGHSGGGKSTIIRLLFRFYDITSGTIKLDGEDISKVKIKSLRQHIGVVPQDTVLFNQDIRYNIRYGRITASDKEVEEAAQAADIHEKILSLHDGYDSRVGERGLKLSGGEKQRIAIARTILKSPEIVLLDEATSALDTRTERNIQRSLRQMCENKTTLIVAHRLSTVTHADKILVIEDGRIVEEGHHHDLIQIPDGHYAEMWQEQLQSGEIEEEDLEAVPPAFSLDTDSLVENTDMLHYRPLGSRRDTTTETRNTGNNNDMDTPQTYSVQILPTEAVDHAGYPHDPEEEEMLQELKDSVDMSDDDDEDEIDILVQSETGGAGTHAFNVASENARLIASCRDYKPPAKGPPLYHRMVSNPDSSSIPASRSFTKSHNIASPLFIRQRSHTQGSQNSRRHLFNRQASCPSHKCRKKDINERMSIKEKERQIERERASAILTESQMNLMPEDCASVDIVPPDHQDEHDPLLASFTSRDFQDRNKNEDAMLIADKQRHHTADLV